MHPTARKIDQLKQAHDAYKELAEIVARAIEPFHPRHKTVVPLKRAKK